MAPKDWIAWAKKPRRVEDILSTGLPAGKEKNGRKHEKSSGPQEHHHTTAAPPPSKPPPRTSDARTEQVGNSLSSSSNQSPPMAKTATRSARLAAKSASTQDSLVAREYDEGIDIDFVAEEHELFYELVRDPHPSWDPKGKGKGKSRKHQSAIQIAGLWHPQQYVKDSRPVDQLSGEALFDEAFFAARFIELYGENVKKYLLFEEGEMKNLAPYYRKDIATWDVHIEWLQDQRCAREIVTVVGAFFEYVWHSAHEAFKDNRDPDYDSIFEDLALVAIHFKESLAIRRMLGGHSALSEMQYARSKLAICEEMLSDPDYSRSIECYLTPYRVWRRAYDGYRQRLLSKPAGKVIRPTAATRLQQTPVVAPKPHATGNEQLISRNDEGTDHESSKGLSQARSKTIQKGSRNRNFSFESLHFDDPDVDQSMTEQRPAGAPDMDDVQRKRVATKETDSTIKADERDLDKHGSRRSHESTKSTRGRIAFKPSNGSLKEQKQKQKVTDPEGISISASRRDQGSSFQASPKPSESFQSTSLSHKRSDRSSRRSSHAVQASTQHSDRAKSPHKETVTGTALSEPSPRSSVDSSRYSGGEHSVLKAARFAPDIKIKRGESRSDKSTTTKSSYSSVKSTDDSLYNSIQAECKTPIGKASSLRIDHSTSTTGNAPGAHKKQHAKKKALPPKPKADHDLQPKPLGIKKMKKESKSGPGLDANRDPDNALTFFISDSDDES